ncbi:TRAP transporter small permease [Ammoniphilus sp. YIM 78166]|uniref:TRAP transporter small permease n=1 Tax=Ammoniphilus sp. YIM 78166 TaxID=1644106 RepID=UPI00142F94BC|nr:TRAP transporter small permease [Ammoniphilus sp. YIM 78166]
MQDSQVVVSIKDEHASPSTGNEYWLSSTIKRIAYVLDKILVVVSVMICLALTLNMIIAVLFRYVVHQPIFWADDLSLYLFCWITFLGGSLAVNRSTMAAVTILYDRLSPKFQQMVSIFIQVTMFIFASLIGFYSFFWVVSPSVLNQTSPTIPISMSYLYSIVPVSMGCIVIFTVSNICKILNKGEVS